MTEQQKLRFISEQPVLAQTLRQLYLGILPKDIHTWAFDWFEDIGSIMRSRDFIAHNIAQLILFVGLNSLARIIGVQRGTILAKIFQGLGVTL
jgi:predicted AAA+ superfamily ATPase